MRNNYVIVSGLFFGVLAVVQATRALNQWPVTVAGYQIPVWVSLIAAAVVASFSVWAFRSRPK